VSDDANFHPHLEETASLVASLYSIGQIPNLSYPPRNLSSPFIASAQTPSKPARRRKTVPRAVTTQSAHIAVDAIHSRIIISGSTLQQRKQSIALRKKKSVRQGRGTQR